MGHLKLIALVTKEENLETTVDNFGVNINFYSNHFPFTISFSFYLPISYTDTVRRGGETKTEKGISSVRKSRSKIVVGETTIKAIINDPNSR